MPTLFKTIRCRVSGLLARLGPYQSQSLIDYPFARSDVAMLQRCTVQPEDACIDDQSWNDLLLDQYSDHIAVKVSIFGQQLLHRRLRLGLSNEASHTLCARLGELQNNFALRSELQNLCRPLRESDTEISAMLFGTQALHEVPAWARYLWMLPWLLPASLILTILTPWAWIGAGTAIFFLLSLQSSFFMRVHVWNKAIKSVQLMLGVATKLGNRSEKEQSAFTASFIADNVRASKINRALSDHPELNLIPAGRAYYDWFGLGNVRHYFKSRDTVLLHQDFLQRCFLRCAELEADLALAAHLNTVERVCWSERSVDRQMMLEQFVHPLMPDPAPLSIHLDGKGAFISGQNGIGKSTLLRALGLNLITARAFGFCYAHSARVPALPVYASMQSEDSLLGGESLYIAELRRARELLASSLSPQRGIYLIDEIFRGTNHLESISAAASVLHALAANASVIVSSHNLVLAALLKQSLLPLCVSAVDGDRKSLRLMPGVLADTNGIALLAAHGFDHSIAQQAQIVASWLSEYLRHPGDCEQLLT
ncbi:MutS-related protein [Undibacterium sp. Ren11W]|uniref:MutS-related protein n=1 Tax=Undibacterium sp. Ren11W TaxID=3413045 RepID=UPI003BF10F5D